MEQVMAEFIMLGFMANDGKVLVSVPHNIARPAIDSGPGFDSTAH